MLNLIYYELFKTYAKWRTYIGFIVVVVLIPLVMWAMKIEGGKFIQIQMRALQNDFFTTGNLFNGWIIAQLIMNSLWVHVPFLITLVAGDQLAGEATSGTFRLILIRPVSRSKILNSKYIATLLYTISLVLTIALLSVGLGLLIFGSGDLLSLNRDTLTILPESELWFRFILAYALAMLSMCVVASLAFLFSSFVENAIGPIIATMAVIIVLLIISNLPVDSFEPIKPYLFTTHENVWEQAFKSRIDWDKILKSCSVLVAYSVGFWLTTLLVFQRKDILS
ncbi:MAG TPA: ABC transporter permease subunit [Bacteroidota bacterium]|nr:ABC transporter permease subunit [Bacteroidota bacterium]